MNPRIEENLQCNRVIIYDNNDMVLKDGNYAQPVKPDLARPALGQVRPDPY